MQRIIPFGLGYAQSAEFSVDEGQTIRFWLVREDMTTTPGHHAFAELQVKSAVGNQHWTTLHVMDGDKPYYDLLGVDENLTYRWVRKDGVPAIAVDRAQDGAYSRTQRAPVDPRNPSFGSPDDAVIFKALVGTSGTLVGFHVDYQGDGVDEFGSIVGARPQLYGGPAPSDAFIKLYYDTATDDLTFEISEDTTGDGDGATSVDWSAFIGGQIGIATECYGNGLGAMTSTSWNIAAPDINDNGIALTVTDAADDTLRDWMAAGKTVYVFLKTAEQDYPVIDLGPRTGRFTLDQNDLPSRLTAQPFDTSTEQVALSAVEGNVVIPLTYNEEGDPIRLVNTFRGYTIVAPGEYEWERSCNSAPGVYLNTGWRA